MFTNNSRVVITIIFGAVIIMVLLCLLILVMIYLYQKKHFQYQQEVKDLKAKHRGEIVKSQLMVQEETFRNVSKDVHKNIGHRLLLSTVFLEDAHKMTLEEIQTNVKDTIIKLSDAMVDLRDISRGISADIIKNNGLLKAFEFEAKQLRKSGLYKVKLQITGVPSFLTTNQELLIFRIMQESAGNIVRNANADTINIYLHFGDNDIQLTVEDNENDAIRNHYVRANSLTTILSRIKILNAFHEISNDKKGTRLFVNIPIKRIELPSAPVDE